MSSLTAIILTKNESSNIRECILSVKDICEKIYVVDSGSDDDTREIAKELGALVVTHQFINYAKQFNWALDNLEINTEWCLRLDADERFTKQLNEEVKDLMIKHKNSNVNGIVLEAWLYFMGKRLRFGGTKKRKLMIFKTGIGRIEDRKMDEHTILKCGTSINAKSRFIHYDFKNINHFLNKLNWYASREMQDYFEYLERKNKNHFLSDKKIKNTRFKKFNIYYRFPLFIRTWLLFVYFYIFKLGFLDGKEGFIYNYSYHRMYRLMVDFKIYEQNKFPKKFVETGDLK